MNENEGSRRVLPIHDPVRPRGRRRRFYLKSIEVVEVRPLDPKKMKAFLELMFPHKEEADQSEVGLSR